MLLFLLSHIIYPCPTGSIECIVDVYNGSVLIDTKVAPANLSILARPRATVTPRADFVFLPPESHCINRTVECRKVLGNQKLQEITLHWNIHTSTVSSREFIMHILANRTHIIQAKFRWSKTN